MADTKISALPAGTTLTGTEVLPAVQSGATVGITANQIKTFAGGFTGGTLTSALNEAPIVSIASSSTPAIGAAAANTILLTGTVTVTGFDTIAAGAFRRVRFGGSLLLTYNATSLILPGAGNITTASNDVAEFVSLGSGNWFCTSYTRAANIPRPSSASPAFSATPTLDTGTGEVQYFGALTANVTAFNLTGTAPKVIVCFVQDATGGRSVTAGTSIDFGTDIPNLTGIASGASAYTYVGFVYNPTTTKYRVVALTK